MPSTRYLTDRHPLAYLPGKELPSALYGVQRLDPVTYLFVLAGVLLVTLTASDSAEGGFAPEPEAGKRMNVGLE